MGTLACTDSSSHGAPTGALEITLESDLSIPQDMDHVRLQVTQNGKSLLDVNSDIGPGALLIPASFEVKGTGNSAPVKIQGVGYKGGAARVERDAVTPIPSDHVGVLRLALNYLCVGTAQTGANGQVTSTCPGGMTCVQGACVTSTVPPASVPPYEPSGGGKVVGDAGVAGGCFDVVTCFGPSQPVNVDSASCTLTLPAGTDPSKVNVGLEFAVGSGGGVCGSSACWVPLDSGTDFTIDGSVLKLPAGACTSAAAKGGAWVITTRCLPKIESEPECGDWSSTPTPVKEPPPNRIVTSCEGLPTQACGLCGTESRTCVNGVWSAWSACSGEGVCQSGTSQSCGTGGTQTCTDACQWGPCGCAAGQLACGASGACSSPDDPKTCGSCGHDCTALANVAAAGVGCQDGQCSYQCASGFADCAGAGDGCTTDLSDPAHCGTCDNDCTSLAHVAGPTSCTAGACVVPTSSCAAGFADCNGDPKDGCEADFGAAATCGSCTIACTGTEPLCASGTCAASCASGTTACDQKCTDTTKDSSNCGACGTACPSNETCVTGQCGGVCGPSQLLCTGQQPQTCGPDGQWKDSGAACTASQTCLAGKCGGVCGPTQTGTEPCGNCGTQTRTCTNQGAWSAWSTCSGEGVCTPKATEACDGTGTATCTSACTWGGCTCSSGEHACNGACVLNNSVNSCGSSCTACPVPANGAATCDGTKCGVTCTTPYVACGSSCDVTSKPCGNCGTETQTCNNGTWSGFSACTGQGVCAPQSTEACDGNGTATCSSACSWGGCSCNAGSTLCGSTCVSTQTDTANCGSCGNTCLTGSSCQGGQCSGVLTSTDASTNPLGLAIDGTNIYFTTIGTSANNDQDGAIWKMPLAGGTPVAIATGQDFPYSIAVRGSSVYWTNYDPATDTGPTSGRVLSVPIAGGATPNAIGVGQAYPWGVATDNTSVYWTCNSSGKVRSAPLAGGATPVVIAQMCDFPGESAPGTCENPAGIAVDGTSVYFADQLDGVWKVPLAGGTPALLQNAAYPAYVTVDSSHVYYTESSSTQFGFANSDVIQTNLDGSNPITLASNLVRAWGIAHDANYVYWTEYQSPGYVKKVPIGGGTVTVIASGQTFPYNIAVDNNRVYWTNYTAGGQVMSVPK